MTSAGVLGTLILALAALSTQGKPTFVLPDNARPWVAVALILFVLCAIAALGTNLPLKYQPVKADAIRKRLKETPVRSGTDAALDIALTRVKTLKVAKSKNTVKAVALFAALALEVLAVVAVGVAVVIVISTSSPATHVVQGPRGPRGVQGPLGPRGVQGPRSPRGHIGPAGPRGYPAPPGTP